MPTAFAELEDRMSAAIDRTFGELWDFYPMMDSAGGGRRVEDSSRETVLGFTAAFSEPIKTSTEFGVEARGTLPRIGNEATLSIDIRQFAESCRPQRFDRVMRRATGKLYELGHGHMDGEGRMKFWLRGV